MLIDVHAHLHVKDFAADQDATIQRAWDAGVQKMINVGFDVEGNFQALAIAKKYDWIYSSMGVHPHLASDWNDEVGEKILQTAKREEKFLALGEMGLDYFKNFQPVETQKTAFRAQLKLAKKLDLPVIIHCRDAFEDTYKILAEEKIEHALLHCFTGTLAEAREGWKRGYYTAFTGIITYPSATPLREIVAACPEDKLIIETDCPYLPPQSKRGTRNEPAFLKLTFDEIVRVRSADSKTLEKKITDNVKNLFSI